MVCAKGAGGKDKYARPPSAACPGRLMARPFYLAGPADTRPAGPACVSGA